MSQVASDLLFAATTTSDSQLHSVHQVTTTTDMATNANTTKSRVSNNPVSAGEKPAKLKRYHCSYCDRAFSRSEHRSRHERSHTKERPFHCPKCPSTFVRRDLLLRHDRTVHASSKQPLAHQAPPQPPLPQPSQPSFSIDAPLSSPSPELNCISSTPLDTLANLVAADPPTNPGAANNKNKRSNPHDRYEQRNSDYDVALAMTNLRRQNNQHSRQPSDGVAASFPKPPAGHFAADGSQFSAGSRTTITSRDITPHFSSPTISNIPHQIISQEGVESSSPRSALGTTKASKRIPQFTASDSIAHLLRFWSSESVDDQVPSKLLFNRYLSAYFNYFHPFLPFIHLQTFDAQGTAPSLIFSICSVGALLCRDGSIAAVLHNHSKEILNSIGEINKDISWNEDRAPPIWVTQSLLICTVYASYSGDPRQLEFIRSARSTLIQTAVASVKQLRTLDLRNTPATWAIWVQQEIIKRTFFSVFLIFNNLSTILKFPGPIDFSCVRELDLDFPCTEHLWATSFESEETWHAAMSNGAPCYSFNEVFDWLLEDSNVQFNHTELPLGLFSVIILSTTLTRFFSNDQPPIGDAQKHKLKVIRKKWERTLHGEADRLLYMDGESRFLAPLQKLYPAMLESNSSRFLQSHQYPLFRSSVLSMILSDHLQVGIDLGPIRDTFRYCVPQDTVTAAVNVLNKLVANETLRNDELVPLVVTSFSVIFKNPLLSGVNSVQEIPDMAVSAKIQDLLCGVQIALVIIYWCFQMEQDLSDDVNRSRSNSIEDPKEGPTSPKKVLQASQNGYEVFQAIEQLCIDAGVADKSDRIKSESPGRGRVSATLCLVYAEILESVQCWGFSSVYAYALKSLAYTLCAHRPSSNDNTPITGSGRFGIKRNSNEFVINNNHESHNGVIENWSSFRTGHGTVNMASGVPPLDCALPKTKEVDLRGHSLSYII